MKSLSSIAIKQKRAIDYLMLMICPAMVGMGFVILMLEQSGDTVRLYAWNALVVELLICYAPARAFIEKQGGRQRCGLVKISPQEWFYSIMLGVAVYYMFTAANALMHMLLTALNMAQAGASTQMEGGWRIIASILLVGIIPAVAEGTLFQGALLFTWLPHGKTKAMWHCALLFALVQMQPQSLPLLLLIGLLFARVAIVTDSCYAPIAMYAANNIMALINMYLSSPGPVQETTLVSILPGLLLYAGMGAALGFVAYRGLMRSAGRRQTIILEMAHKLYKAVRDAIHSEHNSGDAPQATQNDQHEDGGQDGMRDWNAHKSEDRSLPPSKWVVGLTYFFLISLNALLFVILFVPGLD